MPDAYGYVRLSYNLNGEKEGCERQEADIRDMATRRGDTIVEVFRDDSMSAWDKRLRRPGFEALFDRVEGHDHAARRIYVWRLDRFVRQPRDLERIIDAADHGAMIHSWGGGSRDVNNSDDRFIMRIETAAACRESDSTSIRAKRFARAAAEKGVPSGGKRAFGYRNVPKEASGIGAATLSIIEPEAVVVRDIYRAFLKGESRVSIAARLQTKVVDTAMGRASGMPKPTRCSRWSMQQVNLVLRSPVVAGLRSHEVRIVPEVGEPFIRRDLFDGNWPSIIGREEWEDVQALRAQSPRKPVSWTGTYLLSGLMSCGRCGARMTQQPPTKKQVRSYRCAKARTAGACGRCRVSSASADRFVGKAIAMILADPDGRRPGEGLSDARAEARRVKVAAEDRLREIAEDYGAYRITRAERDASRSEPAAQLAKAEAVLADRAPNIDLITGGHGWDDLSAEQQRAAARAYIREVRVAPATRHGPVFDTARLQIDWR